MKSPLIALSTMVLITPLLFHCGAKKDFAEPAIEKGTQQYNTDSSFAAPYSLVWTSVQQAIENRGIPISQTFSDKGLILTDWATGKSDRLFSGYGETKIPYTIRYKFLIKVTNSNKKVNVQIKTKEEFLTDVVTSGANFQGSLYNWMPTESTGYKEKQILNDVKEIIEGN
ncbi:MAG: outer membrane protein assembly factor BamC [Bdellovibrionota bacterium]|nr:outer membrane protein assembly factor BamC [Deltaproteobacteria bacterium]